MNDRTCAVDGCERPRKTRGWCTMHYSRWKRQGDPTKSLRPDPNSICLIDGCDRLGNAGRGWCEMHYRRFQRHGDPLATSRIVGDHLARFWSYVDRPADPDACWNWMGATSPDGYGILLIEKRTTYMPRYSYELVHGPIPAGLEPDHLCRNRLCVNPAHLEPVTHRVNVLRGESPQAVNARKTHCIRGHEFTEANTYITPSNGGRNCRVCLAMHAAKRRVRPLGPAPTTRRRQAA